MDDTGYGKNESALHEVNLHDGYQDAGEGNERYNPAYDRRDMRRLGRAQEVKRRFRFFSIVGYMVILGGLAIRVRSRCRLTGHGSLDMGVRARQFGVHPKQWRHSRHNLAYSYRLLRHVSVVRSSTYYHVPALTPAIRFMSCLSMAEMASISPTAGGVSGAILIHSTRN